MKAWIPGLMMDIGWGCPTWKESREKEAWIGMVFNVFAGVVDLLTGINREDDPFRAVRFDRTDPVTAMTFGIGYKELV